MAAAAWRSAKAAEQSARAMEDSVLEARQARWAAFAAILRLPDSEYFTELAEGEAELRLLNLFRQPIADLSVSLWETETHDGISEVKFSTMRESDKLDITQDQQLITVRLKASSRVESEMRTLGELAQSRFKEVFGSLPEKNLCLILFTHRAELNGSVLVYDLQGRAPKEATLPLLDPA